MARHRRLLQLTGAGLVDSLCLSTAWTVLLQVVESHGLGAAGVCSAAMLVGVALSAPVARRAGQLLTGRQLLRTAAAVEAALRAAVPALAFGAPTWALALGVTALNAVAWTGYAGMRAEVAALGLGGTALTAYGTVVAAVEAGGVALAALLPVDGPSRHAVLLAVMGCYVLALLPTAWVAGGSRVPRAEPPPRAARPGAALLSPPVVSGVGSDVPGVGTHAALGRLAEQLHGRSAVAAGALAFTAGSLLAPLAAAYVDRRQLNTGAVWSLRATGMIAGWLLAPRSVALLCAAQVLSGLTMTLLEGLLDSAAPRCHPTSVTGALATASAGRALGSARATALLPLLVAGSELAAVTGPVTIVLLRAPGASWAAAARRRASPAVIGPAATV